MNTESAGPVWEFGEFRLDTRERSIRRGAEFIPLTPKEFDLLLLLVTRRGEIVTKEEIFAAIWLDTIVEESNLSVQISSLRRALGDNPSQPVFIETIPRRGYRFRAAVTNPAPPVPAVPPPVSTPSPTRRWSVLIGLAALPVVALLGWYFAPAPVEVAFAPRPLTSSPMLETAPALSPDGTQVLYIGVTRDAQGVAVPDQTGLWLQTIGGGAPTLIVKGFTLSPAWSPDGRHFSYIRVLRVPPDQPDLMQLVERSAFDGVDRTLVADLQYAGPRPGPSVAYSPDGKWILTSMGTGYFPGSPPRYLVAVSRESKEVRRIFPPTKGVAGDSNPVLSRDGTRLAYCHCVTTSACDLYEVKVNDFKPQGPPEKISDYASPEFRPARLPDDSLLYPLGPPEARIFWRTSRNWMGRLVTRMVSPLGQDVTQPSVALMADGKVRLVFERQISDPNIWRIDLDQPDGQFVSAKPLIVSSQTESSPAYSPDGKRIAFASTRTGSWEIWITDAEGGHPRQLTHIDRAYVRNPAWSPDGKWIAFQSRGSSGFSSILVVPADGGEPRPVTAGNFTFQDPAWSPDGKWLYFSSTLAGNFQIFRIPAANPGASIATPERVTTAGGSTPHFSADGRYFTLIGPRIQFYRFTLADKSLLAAPLELAASPVLGPNDMGYGIARDEKRLGIFRFDWRTKVKTPLFYPPNFQRFTDLTRSPDGRHLLFTLSLRTDADLSIVDDLRY